MPKTEVIHDNLYSYPAYYDLVFGSDWQAEYHFLLDCFAQHAVVPLRRIFEPACGTGRLLYRLAQAGFEVAGNDLNTKAVQYCNARLRRKGLPETAVVGDMADFSLPEPVDLMFNTINSFRHLDSQEAAENHLACVAAGLNVGGLYLLGLHFTPTAGPRVEQESWTARRGRLQVSSHMQTVHLDRDKRQERVAMQFLVTTPGKQRRLEEEIVFRTYTAAEMRTLLATVPQLELVETYDFAYDLSQPHPICPETEDVVLVLRRR